MIFKKTTNDLIYIYNISIFGKNLNRLNTPGLIKYKEEELQLNLYPKWFDTTC